MLLWGGCTIPGTVPACSICIFITYQLFELSAHAISFYHSHADLSLTTQAAILFSGLIWFPFLLFRNNQVLQFSLEDNVCLSHTLFWVRPPQSVTRVSRSKNSMCTGGRHLCSGLIPETTRDALCSWSQRKSRSQLKQIRPCWYMELGTWNVKVQLARCVSL